METECKETIIFMAILFFAIGFVTAQMLFPSNNCDINFEILDSKVASYVANPDQLPAGIDLSTDIRSLASFYQTYPYAKSFIHEIFNSVVTCE